MDSNIGELAQTGIETHSADTRGKLQVLISDEGFEAGRLNTVSIVISNPFEVPIEIIDIKSPQSSYLSRKQWVQDGDGPPRKVTRSVGPASPKAESDGKTKDSPGFLRSISNALGGILPGLGGVALGGVSVGGMSVKFASMYSTMRTQQNRRRL
jgi:hypothetical protein